MADGGLRPTSRFSTPSAALDLDAVAARQTRKIRVIALAVAIALHGSLAIWKVSAQRKAVKPLTTRFIKREPRLVKPLELRKAPKPKRRQMRRRMKRVRAKVDTRGISRAPKVKDVLGSIVRPATQVATTTAYERPALEPLVMSAKVALAKSAGTGIDTSLEMIDVGALDYGKHHAGVIQDPDDKRGIKGFFRLAPLAFGTKLVRGNGGDSFGRYTLAGAGTGLNHLAQAVNEYTQVKVEVVSAVFADSEELHGVPWVYGSGGGGQVTAAESRNVGQYLANGGFIYTSLALGLGGFEIPVRGGYKKALESAGYTFGRHWNFDKLPNDHPVYHSFYDFDGPLSGSDPTTGRGNFRRGGRERIDYLEGIHLDGRMVAILEAKDYATFWVRYFYWNAWNTGHDHDHRQYLQFGVNTIILALTQEGSIAHRLMASQK